jgi:hypothetical protein
MADLPGFTKNILCFAPLVQPRLTLIRAASWRSFDRYRSNLNLSVCRWAARIMKYILYFPLRASFAVQFRSGRNCRTCYGSNPGAASIKPRAVTEQLYNGWAARIMKYILYFPLRASFAVQFRSRRNCRTFCGSNPGAASVKPRAVTEQLYNGWAARIRTWECWDQNPVPYRLATAQ